MAPNNRPSWRGTNDRPQGTAGGIGIRRSIATFFLVSLGLGLVALSAWKVYQRDPRFLVVAVDGNHLKAKWLDRFACPPLRYTQNTLAPLTELNDKNLRFIELDLNAIETQIAENILAESYRKQDALIVFAQVQCLTIGEKPCLLTADFSRSDQGTVSLEQFLKAFSVFPGKKILVLDAGDIIADPLAGSMKNQFIQKLHEAMKAWKDDSLWVLASHGPNEISLDDSQPHEKRRLFGRALTEALTGGWRLSDEEKSEWLTEISRDGRLSLSELASYLVRRVQADAQHAQTPWILHSGEGKVASNERTWPAADAIHLGKIDRQGRWLGLAPAADTGKSSSKSQRPETSDESQENSEASDGPRRPTSQASDIGLAPATSADKNSPKPLAKNPWIERWMQLDQWWQPAFETTNEQLKWSYAELYPQRFRALRGALLDAQQRDLAGIPGSEGFEHDLRLPALDAQEKERLDALFPTTSSRIMPAKLVEPQAKARMIKALSHASLVASEAALLAARLDSVEPGASARLVQWVTQISEVEKAIYARTSISTSLPDVEIMESAIQSAQNEIDQLVSSVQQRKNPILVEALWSYAGLNAEHREGLWSTKTKRSQGASSLATILPTMPEAWRDTASLPESLHRSDWFHENSQTLKRLDENSLRDNGGAVDSSWPVLEFRADGRSLAEAGKADFIEGSVLRSLPKPPAPEPSWSIRWENPSELLLIKPGSNRMILILDPYPVPKPDQKIIVRVRSLPVSIEALRMNGSRLDEDSKQVVVEWKDISNKQLPIEFFVKSDPQASEERLGISLSTSSIPDDSNLERRLRIVGAERIEMKVEQQISKNGKVIWRDESASGVDQVIRLRPFAGHQSRFRLQVTNRSEIPRLIQARIYSLKKWDAPAGRIASSGEFLPNFPLASIDPGRLKKLPIVATSQAAKLAAGATGSLSFESIANTKPGSESDKEGQAANSVPPRPAEADVSGGLVVELVDQENLDFVPNYYFIEYVPTEAHEYLKAEARIVSNEKTRELVLRVNYLDNDDDDRPDIGPVDDKPVSLKLLRETWMGEQLKIASLNGVLDPVAKANKRTESMLSVEIPEPKPGQPSTIEAFIGLDVNETPRVMTTSIRLNDDSSAPQILDVYRKKQARAEVRSIGEIGKDKPAFHRFLPPDYASETRKDLDRQFLTSAPHAYFENPKEVEVYLALDLDSDFHGSQPRTIQMKLGNQNATLFGDRDLKCQWMGSEGDIFTLDCNLRDHVVKLPTVGLVNQSVEIEVLVDNEVIERSGQPIMIAFDRQAPVIYPVRFVEPRLIQGATAVLDFTIEDEHSGCEPDAIHILLGQGSKAKPFEAATLRKIAGTDLRSRYRAEFKTDEMKAGEHKFIVVAIDRVGNTSDASSVASLTIDLPPKPAPAPSSGTTGTATPAVTGTLKGIVKLFGREAPSNTSDLVVKLESKGEELSVNDGSGKFTFQKVPIGPYKIVAQANYQGMLRKGEVQGVLEKEADFEKPIQITIK